MVNEIFEIIPAIDIIDGKCVRLEQGDYSKETIFCENPIEVAQNWEKIGAKRIHIIDLDGAKAGQPINLDLIDKIVKNISIPVQLGGGIRNMENISKIFSLGVDRIILGSAAVMNTDLVKKSCEKYGNKIIISLDSKKGEIAIEGWTQETGISIFDLADKLINIGVKHIIYTDIVRDGMLEGPNLEGIIALAKHIPIPLIVAGGISSYSDITTLKALSHLGIEGCIVGKALYTKKIDLSQIFKEF